MSGPIVPLSHEQPAAGFGASGLTPEPVDVGRRGVPLLWWIVRRTGAGLLVLLAVSLLIFAATQALPSDPAQSILGRDATPERVAELRDQLGLDRPLATQYTDWLGRVVTFDFGTSLTTRESVGTLLGERLVNSMLLIAIIATITIPLSIVLGVWSAARRGKAGDKLTLLSSLVVIAVPDFVVGLLLVVAFCTTLLHWLPATMVLASGELPLAQPDALVLPVAVMVLTTMPFLYRLLRASMLEELSSEYVESARLRGVPESVILRRHALRNALVPFTQASALVLGALVGGAVIAEFLFNYPGLGLLMTSAIDARDLPVIQGVAMVITASVVLFNILGDLLTTLMTPKLRTGGWR